MLAAVSSAWVVPGLGGPGIAGLVATHITWRAVFLGLLPVLGVAGGLTLPALRALPTAAFDAAAQEVERNSRLGPSLRLAAGAGLVLGGLSSRTWLPAAGLIAVG